MRHDADLTGERLPAKDLKSYIDAVGDMQVNNLQGRNIPGVKYGGPHDFVRKEGREFDVPDKPPQIKLMTPKECYSNSAKMMIHEPDKYNYVEGYYASGHLPFPIEHAWLEDKATGKVVDPTLGYQPTARYMGVVYPKKYVVHQMVKNGYYGIHSDGNTVNDVVLGLDKDFPYKGTK